LTGIHNDSSSRETPGRQLRAGGRPQPATGIRAASYDPSVATPPFPRQSKGLAKMRSKHLSTGYLLAAVPNAMNLRRFQFFRVLLIFVDAPRAVCFTEEFLSFRPPQGNRMKICKRKKCVLKGHDFKSCRKFARKIQGFSPEGRFRSAKNIPRQLKPT
jgi:hypothetical protein